MSDLVPSAPDAPHLHLDADQVLKLAAQSMFDTFARTAMGTMVVDREHRIVWISEGYKNFLPALGFGSEREFVGKRVEEVVPNTLMAHVIDTGQPILVDLLTNHAGTFLVSRLPLRNAQGEVIGAFGMVLLDHPETTMQPLMQKFSRLQGELDTARDAAGRAATAQAHHRQLHRQQRRGAGGQAPGTPRGADRQHGAAAGRDRHRQGAAGARHPCRQPARRAALRRRQHRGRARDPARGRVLRRRPGAYTGADRKGRDGKFKVADGGTLFLDEIGDMPLALQSKLLRVLQEQEVEPLGSNRVARVDVRIVAATSRDLAAMVAPASSAPTCTTG
jgi:transcriptional regulator with PAS, ATPase and Fis domain